MRRVDRCGAEMRLREAESWFRSVACAGIPPRWVDALTRLWRDGGDLASVRGRMRSVASPLTAGDDDLRDAAREAAARCRRVMMRGAVLGGGELRVVATRELLRHGIERALSLDGGDDDAGAIDRWRVADERWWLGAIRRAHAVAVESSAFVLGMVGRHRDVYVSRESLERRRQQRRRNASMVDGHDAISDDGEVVPLRAIVDGSVANKAVRRGELMTRIRGFEEFAEAEAHKAIFVTITCPSKFHKFARSPSGQLLNNESNKTNNLTPRDAQRWLLGVWARVRAQFAREKIRAYGFRIAEPHHDGTPHHHFLAWIPDNRQHDAARIMARYALAEDGHEAGALLYRCKVVHLSGKGGAAAYVAKYVSKNIDGHGVGVDLEGSDAVASSERVEAWAATWGIRQFQQFGGPCVGVWRECRRVDPAAATGAVAAVCAVAHRVGDARADFGAFVRIMGGAWCGRRGAVLLAKVRGPKLTRYGVRVVSSVDGVANAGDASVFQTRARSWRLVRRGGARCALGLVSTTVREVEVRQPETLLHLAQGEHIFLELIENGTHQCTNRSG